MKIFFNLFACIFVLSSNIQAQLQQNTGAQIKNINFDYDGTNVVIFYDIVSPNPNDAFFVEAQLVSNKIVKKKLRAIQGDYYKVKAGTQKKILWDFKKDSVFIDEEIQIALKATPDLNIPTGKHLVKSLLFPGWGDYGLFGSNGNWIIGAGAYASLATGIIFQQATVKSYNDYKLTTDPQQVDKLYNKSINQRRVSYATYGIAGALWLWDMYRVYSQIQKMNKRKIPIENNGYYQSAQNAAIIAMSDKKPLSTKKSLDPPFLEVRETSIAFNDANGNKGVDAEESASITFDVVNIGKGSAMNVVAEVSADKKINGLEYPSQVPVGRIDAGQTKNIIIPLSGNNELEKSSTKFTIKLKEANGYDAPSPVAIVITTIEFLKPAVVIADSKFTTDDGSKASKGKVLNLQLLIQNQGQGTAKGISLNYNFPMNVEEVERKNDYIEELKPNEKKELTFKFLVKGSFQDSVVPISVYMKERYGKYAKENSVFKLSLNKELEKRVEFVSTLKETKIEAVSFTSDVDKNIPTGKSKPNRFALVIGNEDYKSKQPTLNTESNVEFAVADAGVVKNYLTNTFGLDERNIKLLTNATAGEMQQGLDWLVKLAGKYGETAEVYFYYAGHGLPDETSKEPYLIPVDVSASNLSAAIKLSQVYSRLGEIPASKITVLLDACFSGGARGTSLVAARAVKIKAKNEALNGRMVVFSASSGEQSALPFREKMHGMFTYFLLKKIQESNGDLTYKQLFDYLAKQVGFESTRTNSKDQDPQILFSPAVKDEWESWGVK